MPNELTLLTDGQTDGRTNFFFSPAGAFFIRYFSIFPALLFDTNICIHNFVYLSIILHYLSVYLNIYISIYISIFLCLFLSLLFYQDRINQGNEQKFMEYSSSSSRSNYLRYHSLQTNIYSNSVRTF